MKDTAQKLISFLEKDLKDGSCKIEESTSLFKGGILSSLDLVSLLDFIEKEFNISVPPEDVDFQNFDTITSLADYLHKKK